MPSEIHLVYGRNFSVVDQLINKIDDLQEELEDIVHPDRHALVASLSSSTAPRFRALNHVVNCSGVTNVRLLLTASMVRNAALALCR